MAKITFLLGLAGSGKSFLAEKLRKETGAEIFEGTEGDNASNKQRMFQTLTNGGSCIVEEIAYCQPSFREDIVSNLCSVVSDIEIQWICFENNIESANWNVMNRKNKNDIQGHFDINKFWHPRYIYPSGAEVRQIHRIDENNTTA